MDVYLRIDLNLAAMMMLGIVCLIAWSRLDLKDPLNKVFLISGFIVILEIFFETATCILNRSPEPWAGPVSLFLHICLFGTAPVLTYYWYRMISLWIVPEDKVSNGRHFILVVPVAVNLVITLLSPLYGLVFFIDSHNVYHRGPLFPLSILIIYFYFLYSFALIVLQRKKVVKEELVPLLILGILPVIGGILQAAFYGILLMWSCAGFSMIIVYIFLQQRMVHLDDLTGAWTRGTFESFLAKRAKHRRDSVFGLILLDIDGLKMINDRYGHLEGDYALKTTVQLVKSVLKKNDIIARTGGDEFLILLDCKSRDRIDQTVSRIHSTLSQHNATAKKEYVLECSMGAELFDTGFTDVDQLMLRVDRLMYQNKKAKKASLECV
jgi:diguanylate cyclase (GGDEF)-like protein